MWKSRTVLNSLLPVLGCLCSKGCNCQLCHYKGMRRSKGSTLRLIPNPEVSRCFPKTLLISVKFIQGSEVTSGYKWAVKAPAKFAWDRLDGTAESFRSHLFGKWYRCRRCLVLLETVSVRHAVQSQSALQEFLWRRKLKGHPWLPQPLRITAWPRGSEHQNVKSRLAAAAKWEGGRSWKCQLISALSCSWWVRSC